MLTPSQEKALKLLKSHHNVYISGQAGTGKSYLINYYRDNYNSKIPVVSTTGASAVLVGGKTFHSFFGLGAMQEYDDLIIGASYDNPALQSRILRTEDIIIDEVSMLSGRALNLANKICQEIRGNEQFMGGIRCILVGDAYQLPPINEFYKKGFDWFFKAPAFKEGKFRCFELSDFMRTKEADFLDFLASIREGKVGPKEVDFLNNHKLKPNEKFIGTRLFSRKAQVQEYNIQKLMEIDSPLLSFTTEYRGNPKDIERLKRNLPFDQNVEFKKGSFVMIRINDNKSHEFVNGTVGHIDSILGDMLLIKKLEDGEYVRIKKHTFKLKNGDGDVIAEANNFPISLADSISIHKSQGCSLSSAIIDLSNLFSPGMAYVALSRLSTAKGLRITKWNKSSIFMDPEVQRFQNYVQNQMKYFERVGDIF